MLIKHNEKKIAKDIVNHCKSNNLIINPYFSIYGWSTKVAEKGRCPCIPSRESCPCQESITEFAIEGVCGCKFFMTVDYYTKIFIKII